MRESVTVHAAVEGKRYADEVEAQSPFETVEMSWSEASQLMRKRNREYIAAKTAYAKATKEKPVVQSLTKEVKSAVSLSFSDVLKPQALLKTLNEPVTQLPKQLASMSKLKDISHSMEGSAWKYTAESVNAELKMREKNVKLQQLLRTGELIDAEIKRIDSAPPLPEGSDPKLVEALKNWQGKLSGERKKWLGEVRDFFNAEYSDVHFVRDVSGLPNYRKTVRPDLTEWNRWCGLHRSKELVTVLQSAHEKSKPAVPGAEIVSKKFSEIFQDEEDLPKPVLKPELVRSEVRTLIQNWREMKEAQVKALSLESEEEAVAFDSIDRVNKRQNIYKLRQQEIQHSVVVWMMDEKCWQ